MKKYFLTRLALALPVILLVSVFSFALVFLAPGDPAASYRTPEHDRGGVRAAEDGAGV